MQTRGRILVVDDEANARQALAELLKEEGYSVEMAADGFKALPKIQEFAPDMVLTDLRMPGMDGLELMKRAQQEDTERAVVVMTAYGAVDSAVAAMRAGAADFILKPINMDQLTVVLERVMERRRLRQEAGHLRQRLSERNRIDSIIGRSPPMEDLFNQILQVAPSRASVLITGESGTGKELIAAAIHEHSPRAKGPFVKLHCAALAETLLESELFGHERGAFTGALTRRDGRFSQAHGGTLFLDEIGEISPSLQVKLLRFLQEHRFERVGGNQTLEVDVRVIAATHRDLKQAVKDGKFREDLYYRLNVVHLEAPPLRARKGDVPLLAAHFLTKYAKENAKEVRSFSDEALEALTRYNWPGNVRELENSVERAVVIGRGDTVRPQDLAPTLGNSSGATTTDAGLPPIPGSTLEELERYAILRTLEHTGGSTSRAAAILGISARKIQYKLHEYGDAGLKSRAPRYQRVMGDRAVAQKAN
jgi:DNA-binding NtrC family response regulator